MNIKRIGIDLAKAAFQLHGVDNHEKPVLRIDNSLQKGALIRQRRAPWHLIGFVFSTKLVDR